MPQVSLLQALVGIGAILGIGFAYIWRAKGGLVWTLLRSNGPFFFGQTEDGNDFILEDTDRVSEGLWSTEGEAGKDYINTEGSVGNLNGMPIMTGTRHRGYGIPLKMAAYVKWLRKVKGLEDADDVEEYITDENGELDEDKVADLNMKNHRIGGREWSVTYEEFNQFVNHAKLLTLDLNDFNYFMKHNIRPSNIRARIAKRVEEMTSQSKLPISNGQFVGIAIVIIAIGIMIYMIKTGGGAGIGDMIGP